MERSAIAFRMTHPEAFVLVGMGGFRRRRPRALTAMLMVCEMSGSYGLVPLMLVSFVNVALLSPADALRGAVTAMVDSPAHQAS